MWLWVLLFMAAVVIFFRYFGKPTFALVLDRFGSMYSESCCRQKEQVFRQLEKQAREMGRHRCKVLEIGGGGGTNFKFVKYPVEWTVTEPNRNFAPYFKESVDKLGGEHKINDLIEASGENLSQFADDSFDCAISTLVLCTVQNVPDTLNELRRVLKPGGRLYFVEHVGAPEGSLLRFVQNSLTYSGIWPLFLDQCDLTRDTEANLRRAGFSVVNATGFLWKNPLFYPLKTQIYGTAVK